MPDDLLEALKAKAAARTAATTTEWWEAVRKAATGGEVDPDDVLFLLDKAGKSAEDFARDVDVIARRFDHARAIEDARKADKDRQAAEAAMAKLDADHRAQVERHEAARAPHEEVVRRWHRAESAASTARGELVRTAPPDRKAKYDAANAALLAADAELRQARETHARFHGYANLPDLPTHADQIADAKARLPRLHAAVKDAEANVALLAAERDAAEAALLLP